MSTDTSYMSGSPSVESPFHQHLHTNYVPTGAEIERIRTHLLPHEAELARLDSLIRQLTVVIRPSVHGVSPVTQGVHFFNCSFLGNHGNIPINGSSANAGREIFTFFSLFGPENPSVTVTYLPSVHFWGIRHPSPEHLVGLLQYCPAEPDQGPY
jgi:hypothetical protein